MKMKDGKSRIIDREGRLLSQSSDGKVVLED
jgi:hypothetical protein